MYIHELGRYVVFAHPKIFYDLGFGVLSIWLIGGWLVVLTTLESFKTDKDSNYYRLFP